MNDVKDEYKPLYSEFFRTPKLLKGENRAKYVMLQKVFYNMMPQNLVDELNVQETLNSAWNSQRYQRLSSVVANAEWKPALRRLASSEYGYVTEEQEEWYNSLEGKPYPEDMTEADVLKKLGLTEELVQAHAVFFSSQKSGVLNALSETQAAMLKANLKDYQRRKKIEAKEKNAAEKAKSQRRDRANDNRPSSESRRNKST